MTPYAFIGAELFLYSPVEFRARFSSPKFGKNRVKSVDFHRAFVSVGLNLLITRVFATWEVSGGSLVARSPPLDYAQIVESHRSYCFYRRIPVSNTSAEVRGVRDDKLIFFTASEKVKNCSIYVQIDCMYFVREDNAWIESDSNWRIEHWKWILKLIESLNRRKKWFNPTKSCNRK